MALPTIYFDTGGHAQGSGSSDAASPIVSNTSGAAVAGSVVTVAGADLSGVVADGSMTVYIADATNANQKIFKITAVDDGADTITVDVAPTGVIANSAWGVGGQRVYDSAEWEAAAAAGWTFVFNNSPAAKASDFITARANGSSAAGFIKVKGKTGTRPVLNVTNTAQCFEGADLDLWWIENLELDQDGASGNVIAVWGAGGVCYNVKISDGGGIGIVPDEGACRVIGNEITGTGGDGMTMGLAVAAIGNYIHDVTGDGIEQTGANTAQHLILNNIIDTCAGRGILDSGVATTTAQVLCILGNTIYGCGNTGIEITDADRQAVLMNNICSENGNAAGEYNVEWVAGSAELGSFHGWNVFHHSGGGGGANLSGLTVNAQVASSEFITDPAFTNAAGGDFSIGSTSPAKAAGYPGAFLGGSTGYLDIGAVQRQEAGGSGGGLRLAGHGGLAA